MKVSIDTRTIEPGDYFIPVQGERFDGREFIPEAIKKGARILDVNLQSYAKRYRKKLKCAVVAVTGSAGKTTTKDMLYAMLSARFNVVKTEENQNNEVGVPLTVLKADATTDILILEMGMRARGQIRQLAQIGRPTHALITNIGLTHIELLGTQRSIALAKSEIFLPRLAWERELRTAYLNAESPYYSTMVKKATHAGFQVLPFAGHDKPEQNLNACFAVGRSFGLSDDEIRDGLANYQASAHRMARFLLKDDVVLLDDSYNANPDGVMYSLHQLRRYSGRKILVLGDMLELGEYSAAEHHRIVDHALDSGVELIFAYGDQSRVMTTTDEVLWIGHFDTKNELIDQLLDEIKPADVILVKGSRGMKMEQVSEAIQQRWI